MARFALTIGIYFEKNFLDQLKALKGKSYCSCRMRLPGKLGFFGEIQT